MTAAPARTVRAVWIARLYATVLSTMRPWCKSTQRLTSTRVAGFAFHLRRACEPDALNGMTNWPTKESGVAMTNETRHVMTETDALLHHRHATKIEGSREVRDLSEPDEDLTAMLPSIWRQRSP